MCKLTQLLDEVKLIKRSKEHCVKNLAIIVRDSKQTHPLTGKLSLTHIQSSFRVPLKTALHLNIHVNNLNFIYFSDKVQAQFMFIYRFIKSHIAIYIYILTCKQPFAL